MLRGGYSARPRSSFGVAPNNFIARSAAPLFVFASGCAWQSDCSVAIDNPDSAAPNATAVGASGGAPEAARASTERIGGTPRTLIAPAWSWLPSTRPFARERMHEPFDARARFRSRTNHAPNALSHPAHRVALASLVGRPRDTTIHFRHVQRFPCCRDIRCFGSRTHPDFQIDAHARE